MYFSQVFRGTPDSGPRDEGPGPRLLNPVRGQGLETGLHGRDKEVETEGVTGPLRTDLDVGWAGEDPGLRGWMGVARGRVLKEGDRGSGGDTEGVRDYYYGRRTPVGSKNSLTDR